MLLVYIVRAIVAALVAHVNAFTLRAACDAENESSYRLARMNERHDRITARQQRAFYRYCDSAELQDEALWRMLSHWSALRNSSRRYVKATIYHASLRMRMVWHAFTAHGVSVSSRESGAVSYYVTPRVAFHYRCMIRAIASSYRHWQVGANEAESLQVWLAQAWSWRHDYDANYGGRYCGACAPLETLGYRVD